MKIENVPFHNTEWSKVPATEPSGQVGVARWRTIELGNIRVRHVDYSAGYVADHWCERGHVLLVLEGELVTELRDVRRFVLGAGHSCQVADGAGFFSRYSSFPSSRRVSRSRQMGPRAPYLQVRSSASLSFSLR